tara:strand:+ start:127 stop:342 length:216 start_codon:yes stop_codon:yes gene_type:complete
MKMKITNEKFLELSADIAEAIVENRIGLHLMWEDREDGSEGLTEEAQDLFNETIDIVQQKLLNHLEITNLP